MFLLAAYLMDHQTGASSGLEGETNMRAFDCHCLAYVSNLPFFFFALFFTVSKPTVSFR